MKFKSERRYKKPDSVILVGAFQLKSILWIFCYSQQVKVNKVVRCLTLLFPSKAHSESCQVKTFLTLNLKWRPSAFAVTVWGPGHVSKLWALHTGSLVLVMPILQKLGFKSPTHSPCLLFLFWGCHKYIHLVWVTAPAFIPRVTLSLSIAAGRGFSVLRQSRQVSER